MFWRYNGIHRQLRSCCVSLRSCFNSRPQIKGIPPPSTTTNLLPRYYSSTNQEDPSRSSSNSSTPSPPKTAASERIKQFFRKYGKIGVAVYAGVSVLSIGTLYTSISMGVDVKGLLERLGVGANSMLENAGTFTIAYGIHKLLAPLRIFLTVSITKYIAKRLRK